MTKLKLALLAVLVATFSTTPAGTATSTPARANPATTALPTAAVSPGRLFTRTELYFGRNRPGGEVSEEEFQHFVDVEVTKRFPDGLTLLGGLGQFREESG